MKVSSPAFVAGGGIPKRYTCDGKDISPPLAISGVPAATKSLALIVDDPDAPSGNWDHWLVWNMPSTLAAIEENALPAGCRLGMNDFGRVEYGGPCPHAGTHRYFFTIYALDVVLDLPSRSSRKQLEQALAGHVVATGELIGSYSRL